MSDNQMKEVLGDIKNMRQTYNLPPAAYWAIIFRTYAIDAQKTKDAGEALKKWQKVQQLVTEKNPNSPYLTMGELCLEAGNKNFATLAIRKEKRYDLKINMLIQAEAWQEAIEEIYSNRKHQDFDMFLEKVRMSGPPFVEDFIRE